MILTWPALLQEWPYLRVVEFPDEPKVWWWTDTHVLLRGVGKKTDDFGIIKAKKEFADTASLDARRVKTEWQACSSSWTQINECVRSLENKSHGLNAKYHRLLEHWPKPVKWLAPIRGSDWRAASLAIEKRSQQIVAVVMPVSGADGWEVL